MPKRKQHKLTKKEQVECDDYLARLKRVGMKGVEIRELKCGGIEISVEIPKDAPKKK